jgi:hypothetical protein
MTLEEYLRIRKLLTTTAEALKLEKFTQSDKINVNPNNFQIVNTLTVQQNIIISISVVSFFLTLIGGISTYLMKDVKYILKTKFLLN